MVEELMAENVFLREAIQQLEELNQSDLQTYGAEQQNGSDTDFVVTTTPMLYASFIITSYLSRFHLLKYLKLSWLF